MPRRCDICGKANFEYIGEWGLEQSSTPLRAEKYQCPRCGSVRIEPFFLTTTNTTEAKPNGNQEEDRSPRVPDEG
jgi:DNA-directed RNA polymerase subunit RPC12/RpoP